MSASNAIATLFIIIVIRIDNVALSQSIPIPPIQSLCENTFGNGERFPPSTYQCQPEQRCIYIDATSTCSYACGSERNPFPTIQSALDSLNSETITLIVKPGTYNGNIILPNLNDNKHMHLNIFSESGSTHTFIDCKQQEFAFQFKNSNVQIHGFTIQNCIAPCRPSFLLPQSVHDAFDGSDTGRLGGAFFLENTYIIMNDIIMLFNEAEFGGAMFAYKSTIKMDKLIIEHNSATNSGGGIYLLNSDLSMWNTYVSLNNAAKSGGGLFSNNQRTDIYCSIIAGNTAQCASQVHCSKSTVNVHGNENGWIGDNVPVNWNVNEEIYCDTCVVDKLNNGQRDIDYCVASDESWLTCDAIGEENKCVSTVEKQLINEEKICVSDCFGMVDGDYTFCFGEQSYCCNSYVTCLNGKRLNDFQLCDGGQIWNKDLGICSDTCDNENDPCCSRGSQSVRICKTVGTGECVSDCTNVPTGDYQSCDSCDLYVDCNNGYLTHLRCWRDLVWDDNKKICDVLSETCSIEQVVENEGNPPVVVDENKVSENRNFNKYAIVQGLAFDNDDAGANEYDSDNDEMEMDMFMTIVWIILGCIGVGSVLVVIYCLKIRNRKKKRDVYETEGEESNRV